MAVPSFPVPILPPIDVDDVSPVPLVHPIKGGGSLALHPHSCVDVEEVIDEDDFGPFLVASDGALLEGPFEHDPSTLHADRPSDGERHAVQEGFLASRPPASSDLLYVPAVLSAGVADDDDRRMTAGRLNSWYEFVGLYSADTAIHRDDLYPYGRLVLVDVTSLSDILSNFGYFTIRSLQTIGQQHGLFFHLRTRKDEALYALLQHSCTSACGSHRFIFRSLMSRRRPPGNPRSIKTVESLTDKLQTGRSRVRDDNTESHASRREVDADVRTAAVSTDFPQLPASSYISLLHHNSRLCSKYWDGGQLSHHTNSLY